MTHKFELKVLPRHMFELNVLSRHKFELKVLPRQKMKMKKFIGMLCLLAVLSGCQNNVEKAYQACIAQVSQASEDAVGKERAKTPQEKEFAENAIKMFNTMGAATCGAIRSHCEADQNSTTCQELLVQYL